MDEGLVSETHADGRSAGRRSARAVAVAVTMLTLVATVVSCVSPGSGPWTPDPWSLHVDMVDAGFEISWGPTPGGDADGYRLQVAVAGSGTWTDVPTGPAGSPPAATYDDVVAGTEYLFRVAENAAPGEPQPPFSSVVTAWYVELSLPVVRIDTVGDVPVVAKDPYLDAAVTIDPNGHAVPAYSGTAGIKGRGNSTWNQPKKPYAVKLDAEGSLLGMPSSRKWVLLADYLDKSQLRTFAAARISEATDLAWTPQFRWVELVLNGTYMGSYQLAEKVDIGPDKVDIDEMDDDDDEGSAVTGGYLMELDGHRPATGDPGWVTPRGVDVVVKDPEPWTDPQFGYIRDHVDTFESTLFSPGFADPVDGYGKYLDVGSFIDYWVTQETTRNHDAFWSSTFFWKDRDDPLLHFGPIWDHDTSMGQPTEFTWSPTGWMSPVARPWVQRLFADPAFVDAVNARWRTLLPQISAVPGEILAIAPSLEAAKANDRARWHYSTPDTDEPQFLADWLGTRVTWMTGALADWSART